jgi:hypothetical protein
LRAHVFPPALLVIRELQECLEIRLGFRDAAQLHVCHSAVVERGWIFRLQLADGSKIGKRHGILSLVAVDATQQSQGGHMLGA